VGFDCHAILSFQETSDAAHSSRTGMALSVLACPSQHKTPKQLQLRMQNAALHLFVPKRTAYGVHTATGVDDDKHILLPSSFFLISAYEIMTIVRNQQSSGCYRKHPGSNLLSYMRRMLKSSPVVQILGCGVLAVINPETVFPKISCELMVAKRSIRSKADFVRISNI
jgi:hypothetical protein